MNLDITFCTGLRCDKTSTCDRFIGVLKEPSDKGLDTRYVSVSQFADHAGECDMYFPKESCEL